MEPTTEGRFRVLPGPADRDDLCLVGVEDYEPTFVRPDGYDGATGGRVESLRPGYLVDATLAWADGEARFRELTVVERSLYEFVEGATNLFEAALDTWEEAKRREHAVNSRVTYGEDREPNGVVYTFAAQPGAVDVFAEFRAGTRPLEPLVERTRQFDDGPREVFVLRPVAYQFVLVYVVLAKGSVLADTVRETYGCPRPTEAE